MKKLTILDIEYSKLTLNELCTLMINNNYNIYSRDFLHTKIYDAISSKNYDLAKNILYQISINTTVNYFKYLHNNLIPITDKWDLIELI